jgi:hypothetical protein
VAVGHQAAIRLGNKPTVLAMILGSVYLGGAYFFIRAERVPVPVSGRGHRYLAMAADLGDCPNVGRDLCARTGRSGRLARAPLERARILVQVAGIMVLLILVAGIRSRHEFDASNALTWPFAAGFCVTAAGVVILYLRMELSANR